MNIREVEIALSEIALDPHGALSINEIAKLKAIIAWCKSQRRRQTKRKLEFKLKAAEAEEALR